MRGRAFFVAATLLACVSSVFATREIGDGTIGSYSYHSDNISQAHNADGTCKTWLSSSNPSDTPAFQIAEFPIASAAGATAGGSLAGETPDSSGDYSSNQRSGKRVVKTSQPYQRDLALASRDVYVFTAKKDGNDYVLSGSRSNPVGMYGANCHNRVPPPTPTTTSASIGPNHLLAYDNNSIVVDLEFDCVLTINGGTYTYEYTVTNAMGRDAAFSWPAVRTGDHPNGWSDIAPANDTVTHTWVGSGPAVRINGHSTDITFEDTSEIFAAHSTGAICPSAYVTTPSAVTNLSATYYSSPARVGLSWTINGVYDEIQIFRKVLATSDEERCWTIAGGATSFLDLDPPSGTVEYTVYAVIDDVAATSNPSDDVNVP